MVDKGGIEIPLCLQTRRADTLFVESMSTSLREYVGII